MDFLSAESLPWLDSARRRLQAAQSVERLPHSLLLQSIPGLGAEYLANWITGLALCDAQGKKPCGACPSCRLLQADSHPDSHVVRLEEDAQQIKVDQVRALIESLALKSYRGGYKVGIIEGAEALNVNGANAFLKTLEEPTANTVLILVTSPMHRLPATIASRCLRLTLLPPTAAAGMAWLEAHGDRSDAVRANPAVAANVDDGADAGIGAGAAAHGTARPKRPAGATAWGAALALAGGAPLRAMELKEAGIAALDTDMRASLEQLAAGSVDVTLLAERWVRPNLALRITWLENWITRRVHAALGGDTSGESAEPVGLPGALLKPKIRALFELLDAARDLRRLASTGMNHQLALEALLLSGRAALAA